MAAAEPVKAIKAEVTCSICSDLFQNPVTTECGHSFCQPCITRHCQGREFNVACPLCKRTFRRESLRPNRELRNIVDSINQSSALQGEEEPGGVAKCEKHQEPLKLYCKNDRCPLCVICRESEAHRGHTVIPVEEAVQKFRKTIRQHLEGIESSYKTLHLLVSTNRTHLPQSAREEEHQRLKRLADNVATLFKVDTEGLRQRSDGAASQTQPCDPEARGSSPRKVAGETASQGHKGREPSSETEAEKQEETRTHVGHVCEEAPTPKYGLNQTSLDPNIHKISNTTEAEGYKAGVKGLVSRFISPTSPGPSEVSAGDQAGVSPAGQGAAQTESGGDTGRRGRGPGKRKAASAGAHRRTSPAPRPPKMPKSLPASGMHQQADAPSRGDSPQGRKPVRSREHSGGSRQVGISPGGRVAQPPELQGCAVEVTLDPATAHPWLRLSEDRKSAEHGDKWQDLPNNPERFNTSACVLGSEGFTSGRRYWEMEVGPRGSWAIGVARDSVQRKGNIKLKPDLGVWALDSLYIPQVPRKVGVYLDYEGGEVRFYDAENMALISSHTDTFTGRLVPFFRLWATGSRISLSPCQR